MVLRYVLAHPTVRVRIPVRLLKSIKMKILILLLFPFFVSAQVTLPATPATTDTVMLRGLHAVALINTPDTASVYLLGSATIDHRSAGQIKTKWALLSGLPCQIETPDSLGTRVFKLVKGSYSFSFTVTDTRANLSSTAIKNVTIQ